MIPASDLLHIQQYLTNGQNLTIPPEKRTCPRKPGTQMQSLPRGDWGSDLQSQLSQHKWTCLNPNHSYRNYSNPSFPTYSEQVLLFMNNKTFVSVLKNRCHVQDMSIFVFLNADWSKLTYLKSSWIHTQTYTPLTLMFLWTSLTYSPHLQKANFEDFLFPLL